MKMDTVIFKISRNVLLNILNILNLCNFKERLNTMYAITKFWNNNEYPQSLNQIDKFSPTVFPCKFLQYCWQFHIFYFYINNP